MGSLLLSRPTSATLLVHFERRHSRPLDRNFVKSSSPEYHRDPEGKSPDSARKPQRSVQVTLHQARKGLSPAGAEIRPASKSLLSVDKVENRLSHDGKILKFRPGAKIHHILVMNPWGKQ